MPSFTSPTPHFFKVILHRTLQQQKLEIPKKFVRQFNGVHAFLSRQTCLKVADGRDWNVGLAKSDGRVWFDDGWQKFVEFYSLGLGHFLVFRYESKSSSFHVVIFDISATEIEYPANSIRLDNLDIIFWPEEKALDFKVGRDSFGVDGKLMNIEHSWRKLPSTASQRERAMARATDFQSTTLHPSFLCKIWPSHLMSGKPLVSTFKKSVLNGLKVIPNSVSQISSLSKHVPRSFTEMHLEGPVEVILEGSDGRTWSARCGMYYWNNRTRRMADLRNGWNKFARDNRLHVGDVCVFEMIRKNSRRISFKVDIFPAC